MSRKYKGFEYFSLVSEVGLIMIVSIVFFGFLGVFLSLKFGMPQWVIIFFVLFGVFVGFVLVYKRIIKMEED